MLKKINTFDEREYQFIVGRDHEISMFSEYLDNGIIHGKNIWNLYGTGGVGKTTLMQVFRLLASQKDALYILLDSRDFNRTGHDLLKALYRQVKGTSGEFDLEPLLEASVTALQELSAYQKVVLAFDTFEELTGLESWLREHVLKWLPEDVLVLIAGRLPLKGSWLLSPSWRERILPIPIEHLNRKDSFDYLRRCGINLEEQMEHMWYQSKGHPLAISLMAATQWTNGKSVRIFGLNWFYDIAALWLKEVPSKEMRKLVEVASVLQHFNQEMLAYLLNEEIDTDLFDAVTRLSFVQRSEKGWKIHDLMREATCRLLKERTPGYYQHLIEQCAFYYANAILEKSRKANVSWEVMEFLYFLEDGLVRTVKYLADNKKYYWEPLTDFTVSEAQAYVEARMRSKNKVAFKHNDPESGTEVQFALTAEESTYLIKDVDIRAFHELDSRCVHLLRSDEGEIVGIAIIVPLHEGTLLSLEEDPVLRPFLYNLSSSERKRLETLPDRPAGWFMRTLDFCDPGDPSYIGEGFRLESSYLCTGGIFILSPPPTEAVIQGFINWGFEIVPGVTQCHYDSKTPAPYLIVDTRENGLEQYLSRLLHQAGMEWRRHEGIPSAEKPQGPLWSSWNLTQREQEVADLVVEGCSNAEIGNRLFISEMTVKKHLSCILNKVGVKNRGQLIGTFMKQNLNKN
ncbi:LuxR family transcriptional regulator [Paenibacillus ginsengarvi]|uniref:LuxR family transcriptional regulator n=1 Tax=Paenibacillus ginsengarvi TaxID=400777 RepID=UPI0011C49AC5|nr:LuxR family transcriptional regulator [Paenibacillus ginsengarvi]